MSERGDTPSERSQVGRYILYGEIGTGGMASVRLGKLVNEVGVGQLVAIKCLHPMLADQRFSEMLVDEARLALRIRHPNVVSTLDVVSDRGQLLIVMEYVHGPPLAKVLSEAQALGETVPAPLVTAIMAGALEGLHAAHETRDARGAPLSIVHRDVSPQNILVGVDGIARVVDFGVAKAEGRMQTTRTGEVKGKFAYMAYEQIAGDPVEYPVDRRADVYAASVIAWEMLTGVRMFPGGTLAEMARWRLLGHDISSVCDLKPQVPRELNDAVMRGLARAASDRFDTARQMAIALEAAVPPASPREVGAWVESLCGPYLEKRAERVSLVEIDTPAVGYSSIPPPNRNAAAGTANATSEPQPASDVHPGAQPPFPDEWKSLVALIKPSPWRGRYLALAGLTLFAVVLWAIQASRQPASATNSPSASAAPESASGTSLETPSAAASSGTAAVAVTQPTSSAASAASVTLEPSARSRPTATAKTTPNRPARPSQNAAKPARATRPASKPDCSPPFTIDHRGVRIPKRECL